MTKKYWIYILNKDGDIYAYTDDKELAKKFESQRNMKKFKKIKKNISKKEINELANEYQLCKLELVELDTKGNNGYSSCNIAMTGIEHMDISNVGYTLKYVTLPKTAVVNPLIFNKKIYDALKTIGYNDIYPTLPFDTPKDYYIKLDMLMIFIQNFGKTLKED